MTPAAGPVRAFGRLGPDGPWVGFESTTAGYRLVVGVADGTVRSDRGLGLVEMRDALVAGAIGFYLSTLDDPPVELEATQADLGTLIRSLIRADGDQAWTADAAEALDAIDDGLPGDAVALRLQRLLPPGTDPVVLLRRRAEGPPAR
jgi:hypothetical protein